MSLDMHIADFADSPDHITVVVHDGDRQAVVVLEKRSGNAVHSEAVGGFGAYDCASFATEAAAWLSARARPKRLTSAHAA